jgi:hypothetical protein
MRTNEPQRRPRWGRTLAVIATAFAGALGGILTAAAVDAPPSPPAPEDVPPGQAPAVLLAETAGEFDPAAPACGRRAKEAGVDPSVCPDADGDADAARADRAGALGEGEGPPDHAVACGYRAQLAGEHPGDICSHHGADTPGPADDAAAGKARGPRTAGEGGGPPDHADACGYRAKQAGEDPAVVCLDDEEPAPAG